MPKKTKTNTQKKNYQAHVAWRKRNKERNATRGNPLKPVWSAAGIQPRSGHDIARERSRSIA